MAGLLSHDLMIVMFCVQTGLSLKASVTVDFAVILSIKLFKPEGKDPHKVLREMEDSSSLV